ncbi:MAG: hypothetical protein IT308_08035 [Anaerolineaceae bacterium]|nr:hypothetical protein [Anaerolineaceae bacterium]
MQTKKAIISALAAVLIGGCALLTTELPSTPIPASGSQPPVPGSLQGLSFDPPELSERLNQLDACINSYTAGPDWRKIPYQVLGNFYETRWCRGDASRQDCSVGSSVIAPPGQHHIALYTLEYNFPTMFGLGFQALLAPENGGWNARVSYAEGGRTVVGEGFGMEFAHIPPGGGEPDWTVSLGTGYSYMVEQTRFTQESSRPVREELAVYLASAENLSQRGVEQIQALEEKVLSAISAHQTPTCEWSEYKNDGIPPQCSPRPMTTAEEEKASAQARAHFENQVAVLEQHSQEIYTVLFQAFPFKSCWE